MIRRNNIVNMQFKIIGDGLAFTFSDRVSFDLLWFVL